MYERNIRIMGRLFGTDGARGVAITELTCEMAMQIGRAAALVLTKEAKHRAKIFIGKDTRISSDILEAALCAGICSVGAEAVKLGVVPTPAVAYLVRTHGADAGVMISASHNSVEFNGIKLFAATGYKLPDAIEAEIEALILDHIAVRYRSRCHFGIRQRQGRLYFLSGKLYCRGLYRHACGSGLCQRQFLRNGRILVHSSGCRGTYAQCITGRHQYQ